MAAVEPANGWPRTASTRPARNITSSMVTASSGNLASISTDARAVRSKGTHGADALRQGRTEARDKQKMVKSR